MRVSIDTLMSLEYTYLPGRGGAPVLATSRPLHGTRQLVGMAPSTWPRRPRGRPDWHRAIYRTHPGILSDAGCFTRKFRRRRARVRNLARHHLQWQTTAGHRTANLSRHLGLATHQPGSLANNWPPRRGWWRRAVWVDQLRCRSYSARVISRNFYATSLLQHLSCAPRTGLFTIRRRSNS